MTHGMSHGPRRVIALSALALASLAGEAALAARSTPADDRRGTVTACSRYGNGCLTVPVRRGRWGPEMQLRGGTWTDCAGSCQDTLREHTIDFWETLRERSRD